MTQIPAGWYPDPADPPGGVGRRYWDGRQWTEHVHPGFAGADQPGASYSRVTTPDGQTLAGWWHRVGAYLIDQVISFVIAMLVGMPVLLRVVHAYQAYFQRSLGSSGTPSLGGSAQLAADTAGPMAMLSVIVLVVGFCYNVGFLKWKAATPGKLVVGLRVRRRDVPGPLPWSTVLIRWVTQNWSSFLYLVPVLGVVVGVYPLVDDLWPLWDRKRQALHDKAAGTNVVQR